VSVTNPKPIAAPRSFTPQPMTLDQVAESERVIAEWLHKKTRPSRHRKGKPRRFVDVPEFLRRWATGEPGSVIADALGFKIDTIYKLATRYRHVCGWRSEPRLVPYRGLPTLDKLTTCCWPEGCTARPRPGKSYCGEHYQRAYR
jgi:hypothetical protein